MPQDTYALFFFHFFFAATAATIVSGAVAERCQMTAYVLYSFFLTAWVYPVTVHAVWSPNGFLSASRADEDLLNGGSGSGSGCGVVAANLGFDHVFRHWTHRFRRMRRRTHGWWNQRSRRRLDSR